MSKFELLQTVEDLKVLRGLYEGKSLKTRHGYYTLTNYVQWFESNPQLDFVKAYVVSNSWRKSGLFIIEDMYQYYINCVTYDEEEVSTALRSINWDPNFKITALPASLIDIVEKTFQEIGLQYRKVNLQIYEHDPNAAMYSDIRCPAEFVVESLDISDAAIVNDIWYSRQEGSLEFIRSLIQYNISLGVYRKDNKELVAWCTRCQCGFLGTLHVREGYRRHGLASVLIKEFFKRVSQEGHAMRTMINASNEISKNLFTKFGFRSQEEVFIVRCPSKET